MLSDGEIGRWFSGTVASGVTTDEDDIDDVIYGRELPSETA